MSNDFPSDLRQFISQNIESLAQLEVLLLLHRHAGQVWTNEEAAKTLYVSSEMSAVLLSDLLRRGFIVATEGGFRYREGDTNEQKMLNLLAQAYQERRVAVITEVYSRPQKKVRTFADSFRFRKED